MPLLHAKRRRGRRSALRVVIILSLGLASAAPAQVMDSTKPDAKKPIEGIATWYKVPTSSRTKLRAAKDELTAAHNRLPYGTRVRVTHLANGKSVVVRITDRGIYKPGTVIDLCKEAAEKLDMIQQGSARVRLEVVPEDKPAANPWWKWW